MEMEARRTPLLSEEKPKGIPAKTGSEELKPKGRQRHNECMRSNFFHFQAHNGMKIKN